MSMLKGQARKFNLNSKGIKQHFMSNSKIDSNEEKQIKVESGLALKKLQIRKKSEDKNFPQIQLKLKSRSP